jgi:pimeloyl-ACP methyl ester carboxylesterase
MRTVLVNGADIAHGIVGSGPVLTLLHAGIADTRMWRPQFREFAESHTVVALDFRGFGQTRMPAGSYAHFRDLEGLLDRLGISRTILVGASMAGAIAIDFTLTHPKDVTALVLVGSVLSGRDCSDPQVTAVWEATAQLVRNGRLEEAAAMEIKLWVAGPSRDLDQVDPAIRQLVREMILPTYAIPPDLAVEEGLEPPAVGRLGEINAPTLVIVGEHDARHIQETADILVAGIRGARKEVMRGTAHLPSLERPDEFNRLVRGFLEQAGLA